jgi:hypothetical protein
MKYLRWTIPHRSEIEGCFRAKKALQVKLQQYCHFDSEFCDGRPQAPFFIEHRGSALRRLLTFAARLFFTVFGLLRKPAVIVIGLVSYMIAGLLIKLSGAQLSGLELEASRIMVGRGSRLSLRLLSESCWYVRRYRTGNE